MTIPAFNPSTIFAPPAMIATEHPERRGDQRIRSVLRVGKIMGADRETLCLIRNIGGGGLMAHVYYAFAPYESVAIEIRNGHVQHGRVAWYADGRAGIAFDKRIDVLNFLADEQEDRLRGIVPRAPRLTVTGPAVLRAHGAVIDVGMQDISQGGAKIVLRDVTGPLVNDDAILSVPGLAPVAGIVRWREDGPDEHHYAGIGFNRLIGFDALAQWIAAS